MKAAASATTRQPSFSPPGQFLLGGVQEHTHSDSQVYKVIYHLQTETWNNREHEASKPEVPLRTAF